MRSLRWVRDKRAWGLPMSSGGHVLRAIRESVIGREHTMLRRYAFVFAVLSVGALSSGCLLWERPATTYRRGSAHASFTWTSGSPPPGWVAPPADFAFSEGGYSPASSQSTDRGAGANFVANDGSVLFLDRFDENPISGDVALSAGPADVLGAWVATASVRDSCERHLTTIDFTIALEGTVSCLGIDVPGGVGDLTMEFSATP
jgi:hypothetical protein